MIRLMYGTTTADVLKRIRVEGFVNPDPPFCVVDPTKPSVADIQYNVSGVRAFHFTTKWHLMRAYQKWRTDPETEGLPCFLSVVLLRKNLAADIGFMMYSKEARKRLAKAMVLHKKTGAGDIEEAQTLDLLLQMPWRESLAKARSVSTVNVVPWEHVVYLAVITNTDWLKTFCTTGRYAADWVKRDVDAGVVTPEEVDRQVEAHGAAKVFPSMLWDGRMLNDIVISPEVRTKAEVLADGGLIKETVILSGVKIKVEDIDGVKRSEFPPLSLFEVKKLSRLGGQVGRD